MRESDVVRTLLAEQYPALADLPIIQLAEGWDTSVYRVGSEFSVRLPKHETASRAIAHEARWLPGLSRKLPLPTPAPIHAGSPTDDFPWHWSVNRLLPGSPLGTQQLVDPAASSAALAGFLTALHHPAPLDAPVNPYRGVPLAARRRRLYADLAQLERRGFVTAPVTDAWERLARGRRYRGYWHWLHGDLHPGNLLALDGWLSGVIDFGDLTRGDPATDYMVAWLAFDDPGHREPLREAAAQHGPSTWQRAQAWAITWGVAALAHSRRDPLIESIGQRAIRNAVGPGLAPVFD